MATGRALSLATVSQSLCFQSPAAWPVLSSRGLQLTYAASPDAFADRLSQYGRFQPIRTGRTPRPGTLMTGARDIRRLLRTDWDLVQVQSPLVAALVRLLPSSAPIVYVVHGFHFHADGNRLGNAVFRGVERALAGRAGALALVSGGDFTAAVRAGLHERTLVWRLPGAGVDLDRFPLRPLPHRDGISLAYIGELNANKDPMRVLDVAQQLARRGHRVTATVVGDGPLRGVVQRRVREDSALSWTPYTDHPEDVIADCDALLLPSRREGLPRVVVEALATGRPVVARANRGTRELLASPDCGRLMSAASTVDDWCDAVVATTAQGIDGAVRRQSVLAYGTSAFARSYGSLIDLLLSGRARRGAVDLLDQQN
ncbi:MAG: glycosyltransferase [Actinomycetota bacterium]|nr:glycosyltransferase [Actinomycetota bacterium]